MSQDQPAEPVVTGTGGPEAPGVVEWGGRRPAGRVARGLAAVGANPHLAPLAGAIGALALFASLLSDWRIWNIDQVGDVDPEMHQQIVSSVVSFPSIGTSYLVGLIVLAGCAVLAFAGTGPVRRNARLVGLATTLTLLAVLITATANIDHVGGTIEDVALPRPRETGNMRSHIEYGRGIYLAYAGIFAMALALLLATPSRLRRVTAADGAGGPAVDDDPEASAGPHLGEGGNDGWAWRRPPGTAGAASRPPAGPADLTVEPAAPFLPPNEADGQR